MSLSRPITPAHQERICHALTAVPIETGAEDAKAAVAAERKRKFTQNDVTRAVKGVKATGAEIGRVEITRDKITVSIGKAEAEPENVLPFDQWKARHAR